MPLREWFLFITWPVVLFLLWLFIGPSFQVIQPASCLLIKKQDPDLAKSDLASAGANSKKPVRFIPPFKKREDLGNIAQREGFTVGVEVGVQQGLFASSLLERWHACNLYYCVDAWRHQPNYDDVANVPQRRQDELYNQTVRRMDVFRKRGVDVRVLRMWSSEAAAVIPNGSVDMVYVDARHDYEGVKDDLHMYWPKLRTGGILAGHDYIDVAEMAAPERQRWGKQDWAVNPDGTRRTDGKAVRSAVNEFAAQHGRQVMVTYEDGYFPSWVMRK
eukprot:TRINITY_DN4295_c0_g1_i1.p1 TRINITY_DN4295_c0_g1~~TRINITY_DN4295_c0_g1_i1.p1  ORF type:complete len:274 (+),score=44.21 TRINITY_DN4295_c0_g1_i1:29-850(+)